MMKTILITGATSGIGEACAMKFAAAGYRLIITGRREDRLLALKEKLEMQHGVQVLPLVFDVQKREEVAHVLGNIDASWQQVDVLLNNAGLAAGRDSFEEGSLDDWDTMIQTNVSGLLYVSKIVANWMIKNQSGHVINIGSIAGKEVYEKGNVYCASKFAVDAISKSMRIDLLKHQIKVTGIHPGAVETEFALVRFKGDKEKAAATYNGLTPLMAADIADAVFYCSELPAHVCINDLVITCTQQGSASHFNRI